MKVLVTGTEGYIGAVLAPYLAARGHEIVGFDTGYYRDGWLYSDQRQFPFTPRTIHKDLRHVSAGDIAGFEAIVHLAELSNDPLGQHNPANTFAINHGGSIRLATAAREIGVERFIYASSCSVYGLGSGEFLSETSAVNPQTAYAECKVLVERDLGKMAGDKFSPTFLRNATAYGASPRIRFDIVLNNLSGLAWTIRKIVMVSDGTPWRPLVHILDICRAIACALGAPRQAVHNQTFNVGDNGANYQVKDIARIVGDAFLGCEVVLGSSGGDNRSYRVSFDKINERLPGFKCEWDAVKGAEQLRKLFERIDMPREIFEFRAFTRLKQLEWLVRTGQLDNEFYWKA